MGQGSRRASDVFVECLERALWEIRQALGREDILISEVGLHKLWIGRRFPAHEPNTVLTANGLAGMGFALPCAVDFTNPDFVRLAEAFGMPAWRCETVST
jgi:acetolactate synthase-1/2/3 large subunit